MDTELLIEAIMQAGTIGVLAVWISAERRDNHALWSIVEALVRLRLRQIDDLSDEHPMELE